MRTADAVPLLRAACGRPFKELFEGHPADLTTNKGHAGQLLETFLGLGLGSALIDFEDGELKTNKTALNGDPIETIAVTQINHLINHMLADPPLSFPETPLCKKLNNLVVVPIVKDGQCGDWYCLNVYHVDLAAKPRLKDQFELDYLTICAGIRAKVAAGGRVGTTNGQYLQIRTKDSKPYHPIYSTTYSRYVSDKNYAFYLRKAFVRDIIAGKIE
jgi:DNA mismatch repair protein MutH